MMTGVRLLASDPRSGTTTAVRARACIVATGAYERAIPMPGWQLPGVVTPGHALHLATCERIALGQRVVVAGTGPFLLAAAAAVLRAGGGVRAIVELNTPYRPGRAAAGAIRFPSRLRELAGYAAVLAAGRVEVLQGQRVVAAQGSGRVEAVQVAARAAGNQPGPVRTFDVDGLAVGYGFRPSSELIRLLGADCERDELGDEFPVVDPAGRTSVPHVFVAGETARIAGLRAALASGQLAAAAAAADLGLPPPQPRVLRAARASAGRRTAVRGAHRTAVPGQRGRLSGHARRDHGLPVRRRHGGGHPPGRRDRAQRGKRRESRHPSRHGRVSGPAMRARPGCAGRRGDRREAGRRIAARMPIKPVPVSSLLTRTDGEG